jgi:hypothetical protein
MSVGYLADVRYCKKLTCIRMIICYLSFSRRGEHHRCVANPPNRCFLSRVFIGPVGGCLIHDGFESQKAFSLLSSLPHAFSNIPSSRLCFVSSLSLPPPNCRSAYRSLFMRSYFPIIRFLLTIHRLLRVSEGAQVK